MIVKWWLVKTLHAVYIYSLGSSKLYFLLLLFKIFFMFVCPCAYLNRCLPTVLPLVQVADHLTEPISTLKFKKKIIIELWYSLYYHNHNTENIRNSFETWRSFNFCLFCPNVTMLCHVICHVMSRHNITSPK